jgi:cytidylate kinase
MNNVPVITVDGPSGTGKGLLCGYLAGLLGWHWLDSGALYRVVAHLALTRGIALDDEEAVADIAAGLNVCFEQGRDESRVIVDGHHDVSRDIRTETCGNAASQAAAHPAVRAALLAKQRGFRRAPGLVADGRDMGTVVFPDAPLKLFLTASPEVRAHRRYKQLKEKGNSVNLPRLSAEIEERDARDAGRSISPLKPAPDAIVIDTSALKAEEVCARAAAEIKRAFGLPAR